MFVYIIQIWPPTCVYDTCMELAQLYIMYIYYTYALPNVLVGYVSDK